jgi:hypothetical protein
VGEPRWTTWIKVRASEPDRDWSNELVKRLGMSAAEVADAALAVYAQSRGFQTPPRR